MGIDFRRPRHIRGFRLGEVLVWDFTSKPLVEKTVSGSVVAFSDGANNVPLKSYKVTLAPTLVGKSPATVSGSIVTFPDGADAVLLKSCAVTIAPNLDGVSSVDVVSAGKNLVDISDSAEITRNQLISTVVPLLNDFLHGKKGNYTISAKTAETVANANFITIRINYTDSTSSSNVYIYRGSTHESGEITGTFSISSDPTKTIDNVSFGGNTGTAKCAVSEWQVEANATATAYAPYVTPTTHTAALGRTIYGGSVDVVNGTGTDNCKKITLGDFTWIKSGTEGNFYCSQVTDIWYPSEGGISRYGIGVSDEFEFVQGTPTDGQINAYFNTAYSGYRIFIKKADYAERTSAEFKEYLQSINAHLVYKVNDATAEDFTFTAVPIISRLGDNTLWGDGDLSVTYYKEYGYSSINIMQTGKNLLLHGATSDTINDVTFTVNSNGSVTVNGTASANTAFSICNVYLKSGSYILSGAPATGQSTTYELQVLASNGTTYREYGNGRTFTLAQGTDGLNEVRILIRKNYVANNLVFYPQLEIGSTISAYESINGTTHIADLGRAICGGSVDVANGTGTEEYVKVAFSDCTWAGTTHYQSNFNAENGVVSVRFGQTAMANAGYAQTSQGVVCNVFENNGRSPWNRVDRLDEIGFASGICVNMHYSEIGLSEWTDDDSVVNAAWKSSQKYQNGYFTLKLATPEDFTFTSVAISSFEGNNTMWSEQGDSEVTYYAYAD